MSVIQLETRIADISSRIDHGNEVPGSLEELFVIQLERTQRVVCRQLNALRDPIPKLPVELVSNIFVECLPLDPEPGSWCIPMLLLNVCHAWTDIALSTPALWAAIHLEEPPNERLF
ncbi:hypothetical protein FB45DRAFT_738076 [Roridomyces roridus]|uniref:F-box domain-containing protein n=1 Tax=Roridomyces roridus TaxID=1738132 RepID=A0AAD7FVR9_9AGAR|nr:hypothetical protein FB45DRAFT_738076 [Roridomyces roridus]